MSKNIIDRRIEVLINNKLTLTDSEFDKETEELYNYIISIYQSIPEGCSDYTFYDILWYTLEYIFEEIDKYIYYNHNKYDGIIRKYFGCRILYAKYSVSKLTFFKIIVFDFISYMYFKHQRLATLYEATKVIFKVSDSASTTSHLSSLKNLHSSLESRYNSAAKFFNVKDTFSNISKNKKKESSKGLLQHEYKIYKYKKSNSFPEFFNFIKKIENKTISDKKHYSNRSLAFALADLDDLYKEILNDDMPYIDKCVIMTELESSYRIEMFYKWLMCLKSNQFENREDVLQNVASLYSMYFDRIYAENYFPYLEMEYREYEGEFVSVMSNSIFWFNDDACKYISSHIEYLDEHLDVIIALNIIRDVVMEKLEEQFIEKFDKFDFYTNNSLNNFLRDFIGQGQHIKFNKNINEDINIDDLRMIYGILFSKN